MNLNRTATLRLIRLSAITLVAVIIIVYAFFRSLNYIHGPEINIFQPIDGSALASSTVTIIGQATRVNSLSMNGKTVFIDESGNFKETLLVFPGMNIITFTAHDQFGRTKTRQLQLVGTLEK
ncbi:MAG: hypothetical protein V4524_01095 [Patescibacteria group bacterium]